MDKLPSGRRINLPVEQPRARRGRTSTSSHSDLPPPPPRERSATTPHFFDRMDARIHGSTYSRVRSEIDMPDRHELFLLGEGEKKVEMETITREYTPPWRK